ncbi:CHAD domain-containing protein [Mucilaginibacter ginsenosidivorax]|uniref:CHAD domain-containing protein n=1 Tax=Mucilaginibacter ginsenosidivorax TaxID=862126 RepID=A0A5B8W7D2_9SPHI|nr:CHAD domain-containing protein [Mucilaginibacter ginsenosidivorax]QEC78802.1 CHAD domain-containing protein [Mucilaginibacter ginsenosidivorax]
MKKKDEKKYMEREWHSMTHHLKDFIKTGNQESLHHFRTGVKKLRAFFTLIESTKKGHTSTKLFKPVREIFKQAGHVRNAYMNIQLAKGQQVVQIDFIQGQEQSLKTLAEQFRADGIQYLVTLHKVRRKLKERIPKLKNLHIGLYYEHQLETIATGLQKHSFAEDLHTCRKQIKMLIYNYHLVKPNLDRAFNEDYLEQVQNAVGNWHDNSVTMELFTAEATDGETAVALLKKQAVQLKRRVTKLLKGFYDRATTVTELPLEQVS